MTDTLSNLSHRLIDAALKAGADAADAMTLEGTSISIDVRDGALEQAERSEGIDLGLRVLIGQRQACVSASESSDATIAQMAERAVAMAQEAPEDASVGLAAADQIASDWDVDALELCDPSEEPAPADLQRDATRVEAAALAFEGISQVQAASAGYGRRALHLATSTGFSGGYSRSSRAISCVAITGTGNTMERDYFGDSRVFQTELLSAEEIGRIAAERTLARAGARKPPTGAYPVLFDERISGSLIQHLLDAANGASVARGVSWLRDAMGEQVLPKGLSLLEEPHRKRISGSRPFDAEGLATRALPIVENGDLSRWILDLSTARQLDMDSTANAVRGVSAPPRPAAFNLTLTPGRHTRDDLLAQMGTGLCVTSLIGSSVNPNTGNYSRGASGFWVENGQIAYPVNECTIAGNLRDMLRSIVPANDARPHLSRRIPSLLVEGLTLAGE